MNNEAISKALADLKAMLPDLKAAHIIIVSMAYSGSGDEGTTEPAKFFAKFSDEPEVEIIPSGELSKKINSIFETILLEELGGWDQNEGSTGTFQLHVEAGELDINHNWYVQSTEEDPRKFTL
jgi:hypothetical protein